MATQVLAAVTDLGRQRLADQLITGRSFSIEDFSVGDGGHDPLNPTQALTPDPTLTILPGQFFGPVPVTAKSLVSIFCPRFDCVLGLSDAVGPISNIGLFATINFSPIFGDPLVGTSFLFAIGNFPLRVKTDTETLEIRVLIQF